MKKIIGGRGGEGSKNILTPCFIYRGTREITLVELCLNFFKFEGFRQLP